MQHRAGWKWPLNAGRDCLLFAAETTRLPPDSSLPAQFPVTDVADADCAPMPSNARSRSVLAATRARDELVILWTGDPSDLLPSADVVASTG